MKYYFVANIRIDDPEEYEKYLEKFDDIFSKHKGEFMVIDENPELLEGTWDNTKIVIISFNSRKDFSDWYFSDDYQSILKHRLKAARCNTILAEGVG